MKEEEYDLDYVENEDEIDYDNIEIIKRKYKS